MELLIAILMWLGLITNGNTYTTAQLQQIQSANSALITNSQAAFDQSNADRTPPSKIDIEHLGR